MPSWLTYVVTLLAIAICGGVGSAVRLALSAWHGRLPWGILTGNSVAAAVVGFGFAVSQVGSPGSGLTSALIATGFAGGLSTFSSWAAQSVHLFSGEKNRLGVWNITLNLVLPVAGVILGMFLGALLLK